MRWPLLLLAAAAGTAAAASILNDGLVVIPDRIKGGHWYREQLQLQQEQQQIETQAARPDSNRARHWHARVDNFAVNDTRTYRQRFFLDDQYFDPESGLVFLLIGGEGTLTGPPKGFLGELAQSYGALLVALEHRFYGESLPNGSIETDNYRYLTVEQALADVAAFSDHLRALYMDNPAPLRFFTFGGSYPGALSSFYRAAYPERTLGSLSSSGVVHAILEFPEFDQHVAKAIGESCAARLRNITAAFEEALAEPVTAAFAKSLLNVDPGMWDPDFFYALADSGAMADQYSNKTVLCQALANLGENPSPLRLMVGFANFTNSYWGPQFASSCFYDTRCAADVRHATLNERSWRWQKCSQLAYFQIAPPKEVSLRSQQVTLGYHLEQCRRIFGLMSPPPVEKINAKYGGPAPISKRVFFSNFGDDPWLEASLTNETFDPVDRPAVVAVYDGAGHCSDLHAPSPNDHPNLVALREKFKEYMKQWIADADEEDERD